MRVKVPERLESRVRALALREGRSEQQMLTRLIEAGLASSGQVRAAIVRPLGSLSDAEMSAAGVPRDADLRASLRELAAEYSGVHEASVGRVIVAGIQALAADAPQQP